MNPLADEHSITPVLATNTVGQIFDTNIR